MFVFKVGFLFDKLTSSVHDKLSSKHDSAMFFNFSSISVHSLMSTLSRVQLQLVQAGNIKNKFVFLPVRLSQIIGKINH